MKFTPLQQFTGMFSGIMRKIFPDRWFSSAWYTIGKQTNIWIDEEKLWEAYERIPHLNAVISTRAELLSQGKIRLRKIKDKTEVTDHPFLTLMNRPNPLQSGPEFLTMYLTFKDVYGNSLIYKNVPISSSDLPAQLWSLPPELVQVIPTGKIWNQLKIEDIIKSFKIYYNGGFVDFDPKDIIFKNDNLSSYYIKGESKIKSLVKPLSNIEAALRTANVLIGDHGTYGIISNGGNKDSMGGTLPMADGEKNRIEDAMNRNYGNKPGQKQIIVSMSALSYTPIGSPLSELLLDKEIEQDFGMILGAYRVDRDIFPTVSGATNENKKQGLKATIQNTIQSEADDFMNSLANDPNFISLRKEGLEPYMTFDHLPVMQEDQKDRADTIQKTADSLSKLILAGALSPAQAQSIFKQMFPFIKVEEKLGVQGESFTAYSVPKSSTNTNNPPNG
jgi:hypothetical protein